MWFSRSTVLAKKGHSVDALCTQTQTKIDLTFSLIVHSFLSCRLLLNHKAGIDLCVFHFNVLLVIRAKPITANPTEKLILLHI